MTAIRTRKETQEQIKFLSEKTGLSMSQLIAEVFDAIFTISLTYSKLNIEYEYEISSSSVKILASGKNNLVSGQLKHTTEKESKVPAIVVEIKPKDKLDARYFDEKAQLIDHSRCNEVKK